MGILSSERLYEVFTILTELTPMSAPAPSPNQLDLEQMRQQFDSAPYPRIPPEQTPNKAYNDLFVHNMVTPFYLRDRQVIDTKDKLILDAGCGTGYKALTLAIANPGAKIIGVDLSEKSVDLAKKRLEFHNFDNVEFRAMSIYDLPELGMQFDYINCDEVVYLLPDPLAGMQAMQAVLKPTGILRANLHSALQRGTIHRAQDFFRLLGLMDDAPAQDRQNTVVATMKNMHRNVDLKARTWSPILETPDGTEQIFANHLLAGDRGFTIPEMFELLDASNLSFLSMVNWRHWNLTDLFGDLEELPGLIGVGISMASPSEQLHLFELLHPIHRLFDFWCSHIDAPEPAAGIDDWSETDWQQARIYLHPQLRTQDAKAELIKALEKQQPFDFTQILSLPAKSAIPIDGTVAATLLALWDEPLSVKALAQRYKTISPVDLITLKPLTDEAAFQAIQKVIQYLDPFLYLLTECR